MNPHEPLDKVIKDLFNDLADRKAGKVIPIHKSPLMDQLARSGGHPAVVAEIAERVRAMKETGESVAVAVVDSVDPEPSYGNPEAGKKASEHYDEVVKRLRDLWPTKDQASVVVIDSLTPLRGEAKKVVLIDDRFPAQMFATTDFHREEKKFMQGIREAITKNRAQDQPWHKRFRTTRIPQKPANAGFRD